MGGVLSHDIKQQVASIASLRSDMDDDEEDSVLVLSGNSSIPGGSKIESTTNNGTLTIGASDAHYIIDEMDNYGSLTILSDSNVQIGRIQNNSTLVGNMSAALDTVEPNTALGMDVRQFVEDDPNTIRLGHLQNINALVIGGNANTHVIIGKVVNNGTLTVDKDSETHISSFDNKGTLVELGPKTQRPSYR